MNCRLDPGFDTRQQVSSVAEVALSGYWLAADGRVKRGSRVACSVPLVTIDLLLPRI